MGAKGVEVSMQAALSDRPTQATLAPPHSTRKVSASDTHPHATCDPADGDVEAGAAFDVIMGAGSESAAAAKSRHSSRASSRRGSREEEHMHLLANGGVGGLLELSLAGAGAGLVPPFAAHARVE